MPMPSGAPTPGPGPGPPTSVPSVFARLRRLHDDRHRAAIADLRGPFLPPALAPGATAAAPWSPAQSGRPAGLDGTPPSGWGGGGSGGGMPTPRSAAPASVAGTSRRGDGALTVDGLLGPRAGGDAASFLRVQEGDDEDEDDAEEDGWRRRRVELVGLGDVLREPDMERAKSLRRIFDGVDRDGSGLIDFEELWRVVEDLGLGSMEEEVRILFSEFDADESGRLDYGEFEELVNGLRLQRQLIMDESIWRFFDRFRARPIDDWERQAAWFDYQMDLGVGLASAGGRRPDAGLERFRDALRSIAREVDRQQCAARGDRGVEAGRLVAAVCFASGGRLTEPAVRTALESLEAESDQAAAAAAAGSAGFAVRYRRFEEVVLHLFSVSVPRSSRFALRVRRARAMHRAAAERRAAGGGGQGGLHPAGSVKAPSAMTRRQFMDYSIAVSALPKQIIPADNMVLPRVDIEINIVNLRDLTSLTFERELWGALPCRPVVQINFQESHGKCWCPLASSDSWFLDLVDPSDEDGGWPRHKSFVVSMKGEFLLSIPALEVVLYDLEDGSGAAQVSLAVWMGANNKLYVHVREGFQLPRMDSLGLSDPYAVVRFRDTPMGETHKTKIHTCTLNPVWDEEFAFTVPLNAKEVETFLEVFIFDSDVDSDDLIGIVVLDVTGLVAPNPDDPPARIDGWFPLRTEHGAFVWGSRVVGKGETDGSSLASRLLGKFRRYEVESVLDRTIAQEKCLGSVRLSRDNLEHTKQDYVRSLPKLQMIETTRKSIKMSQMLGQRVSRNTQYWLRIMTAFTAWKGWAKENQEQILIDNNNSQEKFASCVLRYEGMTQEGRVQGFRGLSEREVVLEFWGEELPRYQMFGLIDTFIVLKCKASNKNQFYELARSRIIYQDVNPQWEPLKVSLLDLQGSKVRIEVWRLKTKGGSKLVDGKAVGGHNEEAVGYAETTFELLPGLCRGFMTYEREYEIALLQRKQEKKKLKGSFYSSLSQIFTQDTKRKEEKKEWKLQMQKKKRMYGLPLHSMATLRKKGAQTQEVNNSSGKEIEEGSAEWFQTYLGTIYCKKAEERPVGFSRTVYTINLEVHAWNHWDPCPHAGSEVYRSPNQSTFHHESTSESHAGLSI